MSIFKKSKDLKLDPYGMGGGDDFLDMPDFDFGDGPKVKDDRTTATVKTVASVGKGAVDTAISGSFIRDMVRKSLPSGYGEAMEMADTTASSVKDIYADAAKELKPAINDMKRITAKMMPSLESKLPSSVANKIKSWTTSGQSSSGDLSKEEQQNASLQMQLGEIFQMQAKADVVKDSKESTRNAIQSAVDASRHSDMFGQMDAMRISLQQLASYKSNVESNWQRKSLELQFRSYFLARDALEEQKKHHVQAIANLEGIVKNTGLPDFVKLRATERLKEVMRNKFIDNVNDSVIGKRSDFIKNVLSKVGSAAKEKIRGFAGDVRTGIDTANSLSELSELGEMTGQSKGQMAGGIVGGMAASALGAKAASGIKKWFVDENGNRVEQPADDPTAPKLGLGTRIGRSIGRSARGLFTDEQINKVSDTGNKLSYGVRNAPQHLTKWAKDRSTFNANEQRSGFFGKILNSLDNGGVLSGFGDVLADSINSANSVDNTLIGDKAGSMQDPAAMTRGNNKAMTEIIPGYLARIYQELQIIRTGNDKIELTKYDFNSNKFTNKSNIVKSITDTITGSAAVNAVRNKADIDRFLKSKKLTSRTAGKLETLKGPELEKFLKSKNISHSEFDNYKQLKANGGGSTAEINQRDVNSLIDKVIAGADNGTKLSSEQRRLLGTQLLNANLDNLPGSFAMLSAEESYTGESRKHSDVFANLFRAYVDNSSNKSQAQREFADAFSKLGASVADQRSYIQDLLNTGHRDELEELGVLKPGSDVIDISKLREYQLGSLSGVDTKKPVNKKPRNLKPKSSTGLNVEQAPKPTIKKRPKPEVKIGIISGKNRPPVKKANGGRIVEQDPSLRNTGEDTVDAKLMHGEYVLPTDTVEQIGVAKLDALKNATHKPKQHFADGGAVNKNKGIFTTINETLLRIEKNTENGFYNPFGGFVKTGKKVVGGVLGHAKSTVNSALGLGGKILSKAWDLGGKGIDVLKERAHHFNDVYIQGEMIPRLTAWKLKAGMYKDQATGKVIKSYKDISGAVVDEFGNVVLSAEEARKAFVKLGLGKKLLSALGAGVNKFKGIVNKGLSFIPPAIKFGLDTVAKIWGLTKLPQDVYVLGKKDPVLLAVTMKAGGYISAITGKVINNPGDIDGAVLGPDENGIRNIALTKEELASGLLNYKGKPIRTGINKIIGFVKDSAFNAKNKLKAGFNFVKNTLTKGGKLVGNALAGNGFTSGITDAFTGKSNIMITRLTQIRDLINLGLPNGAKQKFNDAVETPNTFGVKINTAKTAVSNAVNKLKKSLGISGKEITTEDGIVAAETAHQTKVLDKILKAVTPKTVRDGSYEDQMADLAKKQMKDRDASIGKEQNSPTGLGKIGAMLGGLFGKKKDASEEKPKENSDGIMDTAETALGLKAADKAADKAAEWGGKLLGKAKGLLGWGSKAALAAEVVGGSGALATAGTVGAGILTSIGAFLASPVVLGALAVAAVGGIGYMGYKYLTKKKLTPLSKIRYAQYGFLESDTDHLQAVFGLEDILKEAVSYKGGVAELDESKIKTKDVVKIFDVDLENKPQLVNLMQWITNRFKPVYLTHLTALNSIASGKSLDDVESLKPIDKKAYLDIAKFSDGPYNYSGSPFPKDSSLAAGKGDVNSLVDAAMVELQKAGVDTSKTSAGAAALTAANAKARSGDLTETKSGVVNVAAPKEKTKWEKTKSALTSNTAKYTAAGIAATLGLSAAVFGVGATASAVGAIAGGVGMGALGIAGGILSGLAGIISSPVVLTGLAIAGTGYLLYKGYKFLTDSKLDTISKVRYAQYGFLDTDKEHLQAVFGLESKLLKAVTYANGVAQLEEGKVKIQIGDVLKLFNVDLHDDSAKKNWITWFNLRFKPIFLVHLTALNRAAKGKELPDVDTLNPVVKKAYLDIAKYPDGPYNEVTSPFKNLNQLMATKTEVSAYVDVAVKEIDDQISGKKQNQKGFFGKFAAGFKDGSKYLGPLGGVVGGVARAFDLDKPSDANSKIDVDKIGAEAVKGKGISGLGGTNGLISLNGRVIKLKSFHRANLDALTVIRYKTYGLVDLELEKVQALDALEGYMASDIDYKGNVATWTGNIEKILKDVSNLFGVTGVTGDEASIFIAWFTKRFLPTYLNYATAIATTTGNKDLSKQLGVITPQALLTIANAVSTSKTLQDGSNVSVWQISMSPWKNYILNSDTKSIDGNIQSIRDTVKKVMLSDASNPSKKPDTLGDKVKNSFDTAKNIVSKTIASVESNSTKGASTGAAIGSVLGGKVAGSIGSGVGSAVGSAVGAMGGAFSGLVNADAAPEPKLPASQHKKAILKALDEAKITDPKERAAFFATITHETGDFKSLQEGSYKPETVWKLRGSTLSKFGVTKEELDNAYKANGVAAMFNYMYGDKYRTKNSLLGNDGDGDGAKYRGRGYIQLTGKSNYNRIGNEIGVDLVNNPNALTDPTIAAKSAIQFWKDNKIGGALSLGGMPSVNAKVNGSKVGSSIGEADRNNRFNRFIKDPEITNATSTVAGDYTKPAGNIADAKQSLSISPETSKKEGGDKPAVQHFANGGFVRDPAIDAMSSGFMLNRSKDVMAQADYRKQSTVEALGKVGSTLTESLGVQKSQLEVMNKILKIVSDKIINDAKDGSDKSTTDKQALDFSLNKPKAKPTEMAKPPVSMQKQVIR